MVRPTSDRKKCRGGQVEDEVEDDVKLASCGWNPTFYRRRDLPETENMPWIESLEMILVENPNQSDTCLKGTSVIETRAHPDEESVEVQTEDESIIRMFLRGTDDSDVCLPEVDRIEDFCDAINLYSLRPEKWIGPESLSRAAWLDERGSEAGEELSRPHGRWLTAHELFHELKKPRFRAVEPCVTAGGIDANRPSDGTASTSSASSIAHLDGSLPDSQTRTPEEDVQPEAERRLIFVNDPDPWSMCALIGTATYHQAPALRSALYKHLASETSIEVMCSSYGWPNFQLAFHLPYSAWRESEEACEDHRFDKNGEPLRQYKDVSVLDWNRTGSRAFVYEGQVSCVVTGIDEWRWVAYCLTDSFFDEEAGETEPQYGIDVSSGVHANPFAYGATDAEIPMKRPREFFLKILEIRVNQVKREWQRVARKVHQSIRKYERTHHYLLSPSLGRSSRRKVEDHDAKVRKSLYWVMQVTSLASQLSEDLAKTVEACDMFLDDYAIYFQGMYEADYGNSSLSAIRKSVHELRSLKRNLESITKRCDNFEQEIEFHLLHEGVQVGNRQRELAHLSLVLMLFVSPIALSSGIFSMDGDVLDSISPTWKSFLGTTAGFFVVGLVIHLSQSWQTIFGHYLLPWLDQLHWDEKKKSACRKLSRFCLQRRTGNVRRNIENEAAQPSSPV